MVTQLNQVDERRACVALCCLAVGVFSLSLDAADRAPTPQAEATGAITNVCAALETAVVVAPPTNRAGLLWLTGAWTCVDRALRAPPPETDFYALLHGFELEPEFITSSLAFAGGYTLAPQCSFIPFGDGKRMGTNVYAVEFFSKGFYFNMPMADPLTLKRDPATVPEWFVLEHAQSRNVLLFRRALPRPTKRPE